MVRIPIDKNKKVNAINIGTKKELSNLLGDWIDTSLEVVHPRTKICCIEYADGQIIFNVYNDL